jgi:hypothetical protein
VEWIIAFFLVLGGGYWASDIARRKGRSPTAFFVLGLLVPVIGVIVTALVPTGQRPAAVMVAVVCPRCNARREVDQHESIFTCWQCRTVSPISGFTA